MQSDRTLDTLLELDGSFFEQEGGFWVKIVARRTDVTVDRPHGIIYSLTLHDRHNQRVLGYDNAPAVDLPRKFKFAGRRLPYDHKHRTVSDKGVPYTFESAAKLMEDFFSEVDDVVRALREPKIWFTSMRSLAEVLSDSNRAMLKIISETAPTSLTDLAKSLGREPSNLSRTLRTMERYGLVDLHREKQHVRPVVKGTAFKILASA